MTPEEHARSDRYLRDIEATAGEHLEGLDEVAVLGQLASSIVRSALAHCGPEIVHLLLASSAAAAYQVGSEDGIYGLAISMAMLGRLEGRHRPAEAIDSKTTNKLTNRAQAAVEANDFDELAACVYEALTGRAP